MRLTVAIPLIMLAGAGTATMRVQDIAAAKDSTASEPTRLAASIDDDLAKRQAKLDQRARALDLQERMIAATKGRMVQAEAAPSSPPRAAASSQGVAVTPPPDEKILHLARVYQAMKPRDAAAVFERLDAPLQVKIASQMRERSVAAVMSAMSPTAASALTAALAGLTPTTPGVPSPRGPAAAPSPPGPSDRLPAAGATKAD